MRVDRMTDNWSNSVDMRGFVSFCLHLSSSVATNPAVIPTNPLSHVHLDKFAGFAEPAGSPAEEEIDRRVQELLNEWFEFYFTGLEFQTPDSETTTTGKSFPAALVLWDQTAMPNPLEQPVLHLLLADRRDGDPVQVQKNLWRHQGRWTWNLLVRVPSQLPAAAAVELDSTDSAVKHSGRICRKVADSARWLLNSAHMQELAVKGIGHLKLDNGPRMIPGGPWHLRQIVFSAEVVYHARSNSP